MLDLMDFPPVAYRFAVVFLTGGTLANPLDTRFQKVSGLSSQIQAEALSEGGENLFTQRRTDGVQYDNLVLERGMVVGSILNLEINATMSSFCLTPANVLFTLLDQNNVPITGCFCQNAYPVRWSLSDFDANDNNVVIETIELAYSRMQMLRI